MKKFLIFISIFCIYFSASKSEIINSLDVKGNKRISIETIKVYGDIEVNKDYSEKDLNEVLKKLYATGFFKEINLNLENGVLRIKLEEYPIINQLVILGEKTNRYKDQIKKVISSKENRSFIKSNLEQDVNKIKKLYSSIGYNFTTVDTKIKKIDDNNLDLIISVDRGELSKISSITFIGDKKLRDRRLRSIIASDEDKFWKVISRNTRFSQNLIDLDSRLLINYYKSIGFKDVKINSTYAKVKDSGNVDIVYSIDSGQRYRMNKISTKLDPVFNADIFFPLKNIYQEYIGEYYSPFKIKKMLEEIDELIEENNLQFVEHRVIETTENESINIVFDIYEGEKFLVERIDIVGNNITNEDVIRGELLLDEGDPYTKLGLDKSIAEIKSRNLFRSVDYEVVNGSENNLKKIKIAVEEKATGEIAAGAGIGTNGGSFAINVQEKNWLGEGKIVAIQVEADSESVKGILSYEDPNYNFLGNSIRYSVSNESNDKPDKGYENSIMSANINTSFEQFKDVITSLGISASYDDLRTVETASASLKKQSGNFSELSANYGLTLDKRNRSFMPTDGSIISFAQTLPIVADKSYVANTFAASKYHSFSEDVVLGTKIYLSSINGLGSEDVRLSKRRNLSTTKRLRGFEKNKIGPVDGTDHIGGNYAAALNFEASLPNLLPDKTNTDINLFLDFGNVFGVDYDSSIDDSNEIRSSTGVAASWLSPIGPMTFTLSQNISKASTDVTESFNFSLGTTF